MKKVLRKTLFLGTVVLSFFLASCKNFLEGDSFLQTLENTIEYVNAPYAKINLTCDSNALKVMVPAVGQITDYKAGDHFDISFEEKDEYQFIKWICEPADAVSFDSSENQQTKVTVLSTDQEIKIYPLVYERPTVSITPTGSIPVEKNSQIDITFSQEMELTDEILALITITIDGFDVKENFEAPIISEDNKVITFLADETNLIDLTTGTKEVKVTIPESFYYLIDDVAVTFRQDQVNTYKINSETKDKLSLVVDKGNAVWGNSNFFGNLELNLGQKKEIIFSLSSDYMFVTWQVKNNGSVISQKDYESFIDISDAASTIISIKALKPANGYTISPYCIKRPKVIGTSPSSTKTAVFRDQTISVTFDSDIHSSCIYYSDSELKTLGVLSGNETIESTAVSASGYKLLKIDSNCYGYEKNDEVIWKNILITDDSNNTNLLKHYKNPSFDSLDTNVLRIRGGNDTEPLANKTIRITLKNMGVYSDSYFIPLQSDYNFLYKTNDKNDNVPPEFLPGEIDTTAGQNNFAVRIATGDDYKIADKMLESTKLVNRANAEWKQFNINKDKMGIWVYGNIEDEVSGPDSLRWKIEAEQSAFYDYGTDHFKKEGYFTIETLNSTQSFVNEMLDLMALKLPEGYYSLTITASDKNGNENTVIYYFAYDHTAPTYDMTKFRTYVLPKSMLFETLVPFSKQVTKIEVKSNSKTTDLSNGLGADKLFTSKITQNAASKRNYTADIVIYDILGNSNTYSVSDSWVPGMFYYNDNKFSMNYYPEKKDLIKGIACTGNYSTNNGKIREKIVDIVSEDLSSLCWGFREDGADSSKKHWQFYEDDTTKTGIEVFNSKFFKYNAIGTGYNSLNVDLDCELCCAGNGGPNSVNKHYDKGYTYKLHNKRGLGEIPNWHYIAWDYRNGDYAYMSWYIPTIEEISNDIFKNVEVINSQLEIIKTQGIKVNKIEYDTNNNLTQPLVSITSRSSNKDKFLMKKKMTTSSSDYVLADKYNPIQNSYMRCLAFINVTEENNVFRDVCLEYVKQK